MKHCPSHPTPEAIGDKQPPLEPWSLVASEIWEPLHTYEQVLRQMTAPNSSLDDRLRTVYGRLHVQALKVAIILAALDWIALGERRPNRPVVRAAHWYRAQQIVETWRASRPTGCCMTWARVKKPGWKCASSSCCLSNPAGLSVRDIYRALRSPRKPVMEALKALEQDGQVEQDFARSGQHGPKAECYRLVAARDRLTNLSTCHKARQVRLTRAEI